jgi:hypothetical protein
MHQQLVVGLLLGLLGLLVLETLISPYDRDGLIRARLRILRAIVLALWLVCWLASGPTMNEPLAFGIIAAVMFAAMVVVFMARRPPASRA